MGGLVGYISQNLASRSPSQNLAYPTPTSGLMGSFKSVSQSPVLPVNVASRPEASSTTSFTARSSLEIVPTIMARRAHDHKWRLTVANRNATTTAAPTASETVAVLLLATGRSHPTISS